MIAKITLEEKYLFPEKTVILGWLSAVSFGFIFGLVFDKYLGSVLVISLLKICF